MIPCGKRPFHRNRSFRDFNIAYPDPGLLLDRLNTARSRKAAFSELFIESTYRLRLSLQNSQFEVLADDFDEGIGHRTIHDHKEEYFFVSHLNAGAVEAIAQMIHSPHMIHLRHEYPAEMSPVQDETGLIQQAMSMIRTAHDQAWKRDWKTEVVSAYWEESCRSVRIINSEGMDIQTEKHLVTLSVQTEVKDGSEVYVGHAYTGGLVAGGKLPEMDPVRIGKNSVDRALQKIGSLAIPAGEYPVILAPGACGVFIHEIIAHQAEADVYLRGLSCFEGMIGHKIASPSVTIIDDGTIPAGRGTCCFDDEGFPAQRTSIVENGIFKGLLHNRITSAQTGTPQTGSARRESYVHPPLPRASNTFLSGGTDSPGDLIRSASGGLYITEITHGQANPLTGTFAFRVNESYLIQNGKISNPARPMTLAGNTRDMMMRIDGIGKDLILNTVTGSCVKDGQSVPVSSGQPTIRINKIAVYSD